MARRDEEQQAEARRIIKMVKAETDGGMIGRTTKRLENHLSASDADQHDWAEVWGTRIGRTIGALVVVVTFLFLFRWLMGHG